MRVHDSGRRAKTTVIGNDKENTRMATSYLSPGVYVEEVDRGSKPIEAVGTNTVGFLGESAKGPLNEAVLITNWSQFVKTFGDFKDCSEHLAHAIYGFFNNGGSRCFVVNVGAPEGAKVEAKPQTGEKKDEKAPAAVHVGGGGRDGLYIGRDGGPGARTGLKCLDEIVRCTRFQRRWSLGSNTTHWVARSMLDSTLMNRRRPLM